MDSATFNDLKTHTGNNRPSDVKRWLEENGIPYHVGKDGPCTTWTAINNALFGVENKVVSF